MGRNKGDLNKDEAPLPDVMLLRLEQRIDLLANIIVDVILIDQQNGQQPLPNLRKG